MCNLSQGDPVSRKVLTITHHQQGPKAKLKDKINPYGAPKNVVFQDFRSSRPEVFYRRTIMPKCDFNKVALQPY